jgi:hypothetical protein
MTETPMTFETLLFHEAVRLRDSGEPIPGSKR